MHHLYVLLWRKFAIWDGDPCRSEHNVFCSLAHAFKMASPPPPGLSLLQNFLIQQICYTETRHHTPVACFPPSNPNPNLFIHPTILNLPSPSPTIHDPPTPTNPSISSVVHLVRPSYVSRFMCPCIRRRRLWRRLWAISWNAGDPWRSLLLLFLGMKFGWVL